MLAGVEELLVVEVEVPEDLVEAEPVVTPHKVR